MKGNRSRHAARLVRALAFALCAALPFACVGAAGAIGTPRPQEPRAAQPSALFIDVTAQPFGAKPDAVLYENCSMRAGSQAVNCPGASFEGGLRGRTVLVAGAGPGGATLRGVVAAAAGASLTSSGAAATGVSGAYVVTGTDNTSAFKSAIAAAASSATKRVHVPSGNYLFAESGGIGEVPNGVSLEGAQVSLANSMGHRNRGRYGAHESKPMDGRTTTLVVAADEGAPNPSSRRFIHLRSNASLRNLTMVWPANLDTNLAAPKPYPWAVEMYGSAPAVENVQVFNPFYGIYSHIGERHFVRNVAGQALSIGLYASQLLDTSRFENISWHPLLTHTTTGAGAPVTPLHNYVQLNAVAFRWGRVDNSLGVNLFNYGYHVGYQFVIDPPETTDYATGTGAPGGRPWVHFDNCGTDGNVIGLDVHDTASPANSGAGVSWTGGNIISAPYPTGVTPLPANQYGILLRKTMTGALSVSNAFFHGLNNSVHLSMDGAPAGVSISNSTFAAQGVAGVDAYGSGNLRLTGNRFLSTGLALQLHGDVSGVGTGNTFAGGAGGAVVYEGNSNFHLDESNQFADHFTFNNAALTNGWANVGAPVEAAGYVRRGDYLLLRGAVRAGASGTVAWVLPAGARPPKVVNVPVMTQGGTGALGIDAAGNVFIYVTSGTNAYVGLDGIRIPLR